MTLHTYKWCIISFDTVLTTIIAHQYSNYIPSTDIHNIIVCCCFFLFICFCLVFFFCFVYGYITTLSYHLFRCFHLFSCVWIIIMEFKYVCLYACLLFCVCVVCYYYVVYLHIMEVKCVWYCVCCTWYIIDTSRVCWFVCVSFCYICPARNIKYEMCFFCHTAFFFYIFHAHIQSDNSWWCIFLLFEYVPRTTP